MRLSRVESVVSSFPHLPERSRFDSPAKSDECTDFAMGETSSVTQRKHGRISVELAERGGFEPPLGCLVPKTV